MVTYLLKRSYRLKDLEEIEVNNEIHEDPIGENEDPAFIMYTSGTTANPKGCPLSHASLIYVANSMVDRLSLIHI